MEAEDTDVPRCPGTVSKPVLMLLGWTPVAPRTRSSDAETQKTLVGDTKSATVQRGLAKTPAESQQMLCQVRNAQLLQLMKELMKRDPTLATAPHS